MPGDQVVLVGDRAGRIRSFVTALTRFPPEPLWVVIGGFAVNVRISQVHRLTNDLDTISEDQEGLVELLIRADDAERLNHAKLRMTRDEPAVEIDVMADTAGQPLPAEPSDRAFALARRFAMSDRERLDVHVVEDGTVVIQTRACVATVPALIVLKSVSMPRRARSNHPEKVGSDIHDLVRLVRGYDLGDLADKIAAGGVELTRWVGETLVQWFSPDADLRYTLPRLRRLSRSADVQAIDEDDLVIVGDLGQALLELLRSKDAE